MSWWTEVQTEDVCVWLRTRVIRSDSFSWCHTSLPILHLTEPNVWHTSEPHRSRVVLLELANHPLNFHILLADRSLTKLRLHIPPPEILSPCSLIISSADEGSGGPSCAVIKLISVQNREYSTCRAPKHSEISPVRLFIPHETEPAELHTESELFSSSLVSVAAGVDSLMLSNQIFDQRMR